MQVIRYTEKFKNQWDEFVSQSKNGMFLFYRDYMEYHADRFTDYSLLVFNKKNRLVSILPADLDGNTVFSHQGLTFGGLILTPKIKIEESFAAFQALIEYIRSLKAQKLIYKAIPYIYTPIPAQEDLYFLFRFNARLIRRDITSTIPTSCPPAYSEQRKRALKKARTLNMKIEQSKNFSEYWPVLSRVLQEKHDTLPVHTAEEIQYLADHFPDHIRLFQVRQGGAVCAGTVVYEHPTVAHTQYLASNDQGRETGALDYLLDYLITEFYSSKPYIDFGISTEDAGRYLNPGLAAQKEGFGARTVTHDWYELQLA